MKDNAFYNFSLRRNDKSRNFRKWKDFEDKGEALFGFDTAFENSKKNICSKSTMDLFVSLQMEQEVDKSKAIEMFSNYFTKSFILPNGGFIIEWEKYSKRLYIIGEEKGVPELNSIYIIDDIDIETTHCGIEFFFDDDFKDSWNWYNSLAAGQVASFLYFVEFYRSEDIIEKEVSGKVKSNIKNNSETSEWQIINANYFRKKIIDCPFGVKGHWRVQRYGKGHKLIRKVFIEDFIKKGYNLN
tara:strand:+ start:74 stop:799 length:726 start_codon:yes stop_codon:yes gene_type:complete